MSKIIAIGVVFGVITTMSVLPTINHNEASNFKLPEIHSSF